MSSGSANVDSHLAQLAQTLEAPFSISSLILKSRLHAGADPVHWRIPDPKVWPSRDLHSLLRPR